MKNRTYLLYLLLGLLTFQPAFAQDPDVQTIRDLYYEAVEDRKTAEKLLKMLEQSPQDKALVLGYKGAAESLMAKHAFNPIKKLEWLDQCEVSFDKALKLDKTNVEVRFLRFAYQHYLPKFLGYSKNLEEDRKVICYVLSQNEAVLEKEPKLKMDVIEFLLESDRCTAKERLELTEAKQALAGSVIE